MANGDVESLTVQILKQIRDEVSGLRTEMRTEIGGLRKDHEHLASEVKQLREEMHVGFNGLERWLKAIVAEVQGEAHKEIEGRLVRLEDKVFRTARKPKRH